MPRPSLEPSEENKRNPGHQPARSVWGLKPVALRNRLPSCIGSYVNKATVNKNKNQAALMLWLSKCVATLSWPTALDAAAQKQISHVIRGGPLQRQGGKQKGWGVCMVEWRQGAIFGSSLLISGLINTRNPPPSYRQAAQCIPAQLCEFSVKSFGGAGVKCFCERLWNTRLRVWTAPSAFLPHPETTSIWWHCTGGKKKQTKKTLSVQLKSTK